MVRQNFSQYNIYNNDSPNITTFGDELTIKHVDDKEIIEPYTTQQNEKQDVFILVILTGLSAVILIMFLYKLYIKIQEKNTEKIKIKNNLLITLENLSLQIMNWIKYAKDLETNGFSGANEVVKKLKNYLEMSDKLSTDINNKKRYKNIKSLSEHINNINNSSTEIIQQLQKNKEIDLTIRKNLEDKITTFERQILNSIPAAKDAIDRINKNNSQNIWRGFNYSDMNKRIEFYIENAKRLTKESLNHLDRHEFDVANIKSKNALKNINNAYIFIQSIFDVEKQLNISKEQYNKYITIIPKLIEETEIAVTKPNVKSSNRVKLDEIKKKHSELLTEISKDDKTIDWIIIGALVTSIVNDCNNIIVSSNESMKQQEV